MYLLPAEKEILPEGVSISTKGTVLVTAPDAQGNFSINNQGESSCPSLPSVRCAGKEAVTSTATIRSTNPNQTI